MTLGSKSGGIVYHIRALIYSMPWSKLWFTHTQHTKNFIHQLQQAFPSRKHLILVGTSAGYSLPKNVLEKFQRITIFEPDWLAVLLFKIRFFTLSKNIKFICRDFSHADHSLQTVQQALPSDSILLFCNVLGQIHYPMEKTPFPKDLVIASYHDRYSASFPSPIQLKQPDLGLFQTKDHFLTACSYLWDMNWGTLNLQDHSVPIVDAEGWSTAQAPQYWIWQITPQRLHWIEAQIIQA